jgi:threonine aldolase
MIIDLRSDTVTQPGRGMLQAMMQARVGDDVFGEDPCINELEALAAGMFGMDAALYCPSGTMSNQIAIKCHTQPGDEVICEKNSHVYQYEGGGIAFNSGAQVKLIDGDRGRIHAEQINAAINPDDVHKAHSSLVSLENTCNRGGGSCYDINEIKKIRAECDRLQLGLHLDGARLFNALVAKKETARQYGELFHTISICLNKGLGCPIGSVLTGPGDFIRKARRIRKVFGGGMRQAGYMAAAGIYALQHNVQRLELDHLHAQQIAHTLASKSFVGDILPVETNIVIFEVKPPFTVSLILEKLSQNNIRCFGISPTQIRMVTHLDINESMIRTVIKTIEAL